MPDRAVVLLSPRTLIFQDVYLRLQCAVACYKFGRFDAAETYLLSAMRLGLHVGFITPFAEKISYFGGLLEQVLLCEFPNYHDKIIGRWEVNSKNWIDFHNRFTKDNIVKMLSLRDYQIAKLYAEGTTYKEIAGKFNMSVKAVEKRMSIIYQTLFVTARNKRKEIAKLIM